MMLAAKALLAQNLNPTEADVREALSGILCRETGYVKPVEAILRAAAYLRGEDVPPYDGPQIVDATYFAETPPADDTPDFSGGQSSSAIAQSPIVTAPHRHRTEIWHPGNGRCRQTRNESRCRSNSPKATPPS